MGIFEGFRVGVTQEPHKHSHYVSLLTHLFRNPAPRDVDIGGGEDEEDELGRKRKAEDQGGRDGGEAGVVECGREVLDDLSKAFRGWVEDRQWLNMRLTVSPVLHSPCLCPCWDARWGVTWSRGWSIGY